MRNRIAKTDFIGPTDNAHEADARLILLIFICNHHAHTRNACLQALKYATAGKGPDGDFFRFDSRSANKQTYDHFEFTIRALYQQLQTVESEGIWSKEKLEVWYQEAIEIMMEAYLRVASTYMRAKSDLYRPLNFLFKLRREGKTPTGHGKLLKLVLYYASAYLDQNPDAKPIVGLEAFLDSVLGRFADNIKVGKFDPQDWEPVKKILEFMLDRLYYKRNLIASVKQMKKTLEGAVGQEADRTSKAANRRFALEQALSFANFVLAASSSK